MFGHGHSIGTGSVHDRDALTGGGLKFNVVHADTGAPDHA